MDEMKITEEILHYYLNKLAHVQALLQDCSINLRHMKISADESLEGASAGELLIKLSELEDMLAHIGADTEKAQALLSHIPYTNTAL